MSRSTFSDLPATWVKVSLQDVCQINPRQLPGDALSPNSLVTFVPMAAVDEFDGKITQPEERTYTEVKRGFTPFRNGDVLFAKITPSMENGKAAIAENLINGIGFGSTEFHVLRPGSLVLAEWVFALIRQPIFRTAAKASFVGTAGQQRVPAKFLENFEIPLPTLPEQQRIVTILRKADELRQLRRQVNARAQQLLPALFDEMFGDFSQKSDYDWLKLEEVADVVSGVTKGRRLPPGKTVTVPYLRVANVQAGYIDLTEIKTIEALPSEVEQYQLQYGDVVLTEGGDFDKLGRGAMWTHDIPNCIHQNHVFRVRVKPEFLHPLFFTQFLTTNFAKIYFLQAAKQTTNLASINMTQLRALPVPVPLMMLQQAFVKKVEKANNLIGMQSTSDGKSERLFQSLLTRAFTGELTVAWREAHAAELAEAAAERDRLLNQPIALETKPLIIAPPDLGAPTLTVKPSRAIYADLDTATQSLLAAAQTRPAYFRPADLINGNGLTAVQVEAGLRVLAALGFVRQVGLEGQLLYRCIDPIGESAPKPELLP